jgi:hypothetical protein
MLEKIPQEGGSVTIIGESNASKLTFSLTGTGFSLGEISIVVNETATEITSGTAIPGDPGASAKYAFAVVVTAAANATAAERSANLTVTPQEGTAVQKTVTQTAGDVTLSLSAATISLTAAGTAKAITVTSNTNWTVS